MLSLGTLSVIFHRLLSSCVISVRSPYHFVYRSLLKCFPYFIYAFVFFPLFSNRAACAYMFVSLSTVNVIFRMLMQSLESLTLTLKS